MSIGTTWDSNLTRNELITTAFRKIGGLAGSQALSASQLARGIEALNLIIREEDLKQQGDNKSLWALSTSALPVTANRIIYTTADGLDNNITEIVTVMYRDTSGDDTEIDILNEQQYNNLADKNETGDVEAVFLKPNTALASQKLYVWPTPTAAGTTSVVTGTDANTYRCIMGHTSSTDNKPITGGDWSSYWQLGGSSPAAWATATAYTNGNVILITFKRPLYDFDLAGDNPDMPSGWNRYLIYRLAHDLAAEYGVALDERNWIEAQFIKAYSLLFPSIKPKTTDRPKAKFY